MKIYRALNSGFCFGVKRAISLAQQALERGDKRLIFSYGELIHNSQIVKELEEAGIQVINEAENVHDGIVIIRSHGITKQDRDILIRNGNVLIDATCPYVTRTHELITEMVDRDYKVFIMGDEQHPEVIGMLSYGAESTEVIDPDIRVITGRYQKASLISQTTQKMNDFSRISSLLLPLTKELRIFNTICLATSDRQRSSICLAENTDLVFVIGGKHSSNTKQLHSLCSEKSECYHIEDADEIRPEILTGKNRIGITAGASTPDEIIIRVYNKIKEINRDSDYANSIDDIPLFKEESC